jgi:NADH-quinone oxidoreductase subunit L
MDQLIYLLIVPPVIGVVINGLFGTRFTERLVSAIAVAAVGIPLVFSIILFHALLQAPVSEKILTAHVYRWLSAGDIHIDIGFVLDPLAMVMVLVVLFVGFVIHVYSTSYMRSDPGFRRFFVCMNLFIFFMLVLVLADNLVLLFVGWEGVGLCSYLLIGFWYEKTSAANAGRKAFVVNRIGDCGFILGILVAAIAFQTVSFSEIKTILAGDHTIPILTLTTISLLLFMGAVGKSAQFPLHVWLPDAMEGPTPVSALIHAATMVNAGVYLLCRIVPLLQQTQHVLPFIAAVGLITAVYAALSAFGQTDIKRILAYSTISQIGFMFMAVGSGIYVAGMFHLVTHGIFKGLLFLGAGAIMHALHEEKNIQRMGGLSNQLPAVSLTFLVGLMALGGIFPLSGFISKDAILWGSFEHYGFWYWLIGVFGALVTALYCGKLFGIAFVGRRRFGENIHRPDTIITGPLIVLALCAFLLGIPGLPLFTKDTYFSRFLESSFFEGLEEYGVTHGIHPHSLEALLMVIVAVGAIVIFVIALRGFSTHREKTLRFEQTHARATMLMHTGFWMDRIYEIVWTRPFKWIARMCYSIIDVVIIDGAVNGAGKVAEKWGRLFAEMQTGYIRYYAVSIILGMFILVGIAYMFLI